jgi:Flp pilus assembly protein TadD
MTLFWAGFLALTFVKSASAESARDICLQASGAKAISSCSEAIRANQKDAEAYSSRGAALAESGKYDAAIGDFTQAIKYRNG